MAVKENWRTPTTSKEDNYKINVTTVAAMTEMTKGNSLKETGKEAKGKAYQDIIRSDELAEGVVISAENTTKTREEK